MSREKLSSDAKQLIETEPHGKTDALVHTTRTVSSDDRSTLESLGATVRTVAGDILTTRVPVNRLQELADLDIVAYVEISRPLMPEGSRTHEEPRAGEEP